MSAQNDFKIQAYSKKEISALYGVSMKTFKRWLHRKVTDLGDYDGRAYTPKQIQIIIDKLGTP